MGQVLHGCARTTQAVRRSLQTSQESVANLAKRYSINPNTGRKWQKRPFVQDMPMGPKERRSTVLTRQEEAMVVALRRHTLLPLDDCLYALQETIPHLSRSSLHRCFQRHRISRLPSVQEQNKPLAKKFKKYALGYVHIDLCEVRTEQGKLYLFVAIDRTSMFTFVKLHTERTKQVAADFLRDLLKAVPSTVHTVLTDNGIQFTHRAQDRNAGVHLFDRVCVQHGIDHRLTQLNHHWTNGQVERMNRTLKEATVKRYHSGSHQQLQQHLDAFVTAYNHAKRLKALKGLTPYGYILSIWSKQPELFSIDPRYHTPGPYT